MPQLARIPSNSNVIPLERSVTTTPSSGEVASAQTSRSVARLVVDATCDLPQQWLQAHDIIVLPIKIEVGTWSLLDNRDPFSTQEFFHKEISTRGVSAQSVPLSTEECVQHLSPWVTGDTNELIQITLSAARSKIYMNSLAAAQSLSLVGTRARREAGLTDPFQMRVVDSENFFTGQALLAAYAAHKLDQKIAVEKLLVQLTQLRKNIHTLVVPDDLFYIYNRGRTKGDRSIGWASYRVGSALDVKPIIYGNQGQTGPIAKVRKRDAAIARAFEWITREVERGLMIPFVCVSYAGALEELTSMPCYRMLRIACAQHRIDLLCAPMSMSGGLNVGARAMAISCATQAPQFLGR